MPCNQWLPLQVWTFEETERETCHSFEVTELCLTNLGIIDTFSKIFVATFSSLHPRQCSEDMRAESLKISLKHACVGLVFLKNNIVEGDHFKTE